MQQCLSFISTAVMARQWLNCFTASKGIERNSHENEGAFFFNLAINNNYQEVSIQETNTVEILKCHKLRKRV